MPTRKHSKNESPKPSARRKRGRLENDSAISPITPSLQLQPGEALVDLSPPPADWNEHRGELMARVEHLERLGFDAAWPSVFLLLRTDVRELLGRVRRTLQVHGFQVAGVPDGLLNPLGDGKTWVVRCVPTAKIAPGQDAAELAWRCLEVEGVKVAARPTWDNSSLLIPLCEVSAQRKGSSAAQRPRMVEHKTKGNRPTEHDFAGRVKDKLDNINLYPHMNALEIAQATGLSRSAVYEHPSLEPYPTGTKKRLWYTRSVLNLVEPNE
jgi:hypothetical protein